MKIYTDCIPCLLRQGIEAARINNCTEEQEEKILKETIKIIANYDEYDSSPELARATHDIVKKITKVDDAYRTIKDRDINLAKSLMPHSKALLNQVDDEILYSAKLAAIGNILDSAIIKNANLEQNIDKEFHKDFAICDINRFKKDLETAKIILYISDNCGETVFDTLFLESIKNNSNAKIIYASREIPIINDATVEDAIISGVDKFAKVISSGSVYPGTVISKANAEFVKIYNNADIVISKGQGNYETLSDEKRGIYFLLKAKCKLIANLIDVPMGSYIFKFI